MEKLCKSTLNEAVHSVSTHKLEWETLIFKKCSSRELVVILLYLLNNEFHKNQYCINTYILQKYHKHALLFQHETKKQKAIKPSRYPPTYCVHFPERIYFHVRKSKKHLLYTILSSLTYTI